MDLCRWTQTATCYTASSWCDTETFTAEEADCCCSGSRRRQGLAGQTRPAADRLYRVKILWFKTHHPALWAKLHTVLLPHDYLNFWLTGERVAEYGDASGTGLFDVRAVAGVKPPSILSMTAAVYGMPCRRSKRGMLHRHGACSRRKSSACGGSSGLDRRRRQHDGGHRFRQHRAGTVTLSLGTLKHAIRGPPRPSWQNPT